MLRSYLVRNRFSTRGFRWVPPERKNNSSSSVVAVGVPLPGKFSEMYKDPTFFFRTPKLFFFERFFFLVATWTFFFCFQNYRRPILRKTRTPLKGWGGGSAEKARGKKKGSEKDKKTTSFEYFFPLPKLPQPKTPQQPKSY